MDLTLKKEFLIHLIFASLSKEIDTFVVNYNIQPEKWDLERLMATVMDLGFYLCVCAVKTFLMQFGENFLFLFF